MSSPPHHCTAFEGRRRLATGSIDEVALAAKALLDRDPDAAVLVFDDATARPIDIDYRGGPQDVVRRLAERFIPSEPAAPRTRGRPRLGVTAREVTLLPRHWDWLAGQSGGASVALRKLVEEARRMDEAPARRREAQQAAYRFMTAMAGDEPGFEEAIRALFSGDAARLETETAQWPADVRDHAAALARGAFV